MGLFSSKKTYVSSVAFNLAGDEANRPNFLKTAVTSHVLLSSRPFISDTLSESYRYGPGMKLRSFYRWAEDNYNLIGVPNSNLTTTPTMDPNKIAAQVPHATGERVNVLQAELGEGDFAFWAEQYMFANYPELVDTEWSSDYNEVTDQIVITFADTTTVSFTPAGFVRNGAFLYVTYNKTTNPAPEPYTEGTEVILPTGAAFPSTSGWGTVSAVTTPRETLLNKLVTVTESFSDGRDDLVTATPSSVTQSWNQFLGSYARSSYEGNDGGSLDGNIVKEELMYLIQYSIITDTENTVVVEEEIESGVTKTTTTVTKDQTFTLGRKYRIDHRFNYSKAWTPTQIYIYRIGSGNAVLDAMIYDTSGLNGYFPFIPLRLDNKFLSPSYLPAAYNLAGEAYKKAMGRKNDISDLISDLAGHENLADIDYAYVMFGVSLNVRDNSCRKYIYRFFDKIRTNRTVNRPGSGNWQAPMQDYVNWSNFYMDWRLDQLDPGSPLFGDPEPEPSVYRSVPISSINIRSSGSIPSNVDIRISWSEIKRVTGSGLGRPGAKKGEYWFDHNPPIVYQIPVRKENGKILAKTSRGETARLYHQISDTQWEALDIIGLVHRNYIYKGKFVETWASDALTDNEETGFIIPIHYQTFREMSLVDSTQMSSACVFMVLNCYRVKKTGFLGSIFGKIFAFLAIIAITVLTGGAGAVTAGILGTNAAIGAALGFAGIVGVIVGAVANAIVAMVIMKAVSLVSTAVFGKKFGNLIAAVVTIVGMSLTGDFSSGFSMNWSALTDMNNIMALTNAVGNTYASIVAGKVADTMAKTQDLLSDYNDKSKEIDSLYEQNIGYSLGAFNPLGFVDTFNVYAEPPETFLARTLMTGSDLIEYQMSLLTDFADLSLSINLPV